MQGMPLPAKGILILKAIYLMLQHYSVNQQCSDMLFFPMELKNRVANTSTSSMNVSTMGSSESLNKKLAQRRYRKGLWVVEVFHLF